MKPRATSPLTQSRGTGSSLEPAKIVHLPWAPMFAFAEIWLFHCRQHTPLVSATDHTELSSFPK